MKVKISRKKLIKLAFQAIDKVPNVSDEDRKHMLYAACTMDQVALDEWIVDGKCGCLVGTMLLNADDPDAKAAFDTGRKFSPASGPLEEVGVEFDNLLAAVLVEKYGIEELNQRRNAQAKEDDRLFSVVQVVD
jgi:hypothetical protein